MLINIEYYTQVDDIKEIDVEPNTCVISDAIQQAIEIVAKEADYKYFKSIKIYF